MKIYSVEVYKDDDGEWRWKMYSKRNGKIVGASTEGYKNRKAAFDNLEIVTDISFGLFEKITKNLFHYSLPLS